MVASSLLCSRSGWPPDMPDLAALQNLYKDFESLDMAEKVLTPYFSYFAVPRHERGWLLRPVNAGPAGRQAEVFQQV